MSANHRAEESFRIGGTAVRDVIQRCSGSVTIGFPVAAKLIDAHSQPK